jgi:hypothetical protein
MALEATPETGAITVDQAVGLLGQAPAAAPEAPREAAAEPSPAPAEVDETEPTTPAEPTAEDEAPEPEAVTGEPERESEDAGPPPIRAPQSWDAEAKAKFEALPRDLQEVVLARETDRDKAVQRSVQEAADARKLAEARAAEAESVTQIKAVLDQILPAALQTFRHKWSDWTPLRQAEMARADPAAYIARKAEFEAEAAEMGRLNAVNQETQQAAYRQFVQTEMAKLATLAPALADPKEGPARRNALGAYLAREGVAQDQIPQLDANTIRLAHKAMLWDEAQARAATAASPSRTATAPASAPVRPAAGSVAPSRQRSREAAIQRLDQTGSVDDAVRALKAKRG